MTVEPIENAFEEQAIYALAASPSFETDGACFAATATGLLVSTDRGVTFTDAYASMKLPEALPTPAVAISPDFASDGTVFAGVYGAILRSYDRGASWSYAELRTPPPVVTCLAVSPAFDQDGILFAGTLEDGVFRSGDRGSRWAAWNFGLIDLRVMCLAISPTYGQDETLLVGTESGIFRSTNGGRAWRELGLPTELAPVLSVAFSPDYVRDGVLFAGTESNGPWISRDRGRSWELIEALGDEAVNALIVRQLPGSLAVAAVVGEQIFVSSDTGETWRTISLDHDVIAMCMAAPCGLGPGEDVFVGCGDGVVRTVKV